MAKLLVVASIFLLNAYATGVMGAQDTQVCKKRCADKMQQCSSRSLKSSMRISSSPMGMSNMPSRSDTKKVESKCSNDKRACDRACK